MLSSKKSKPDATTIEVKMLFKKFIFSKTMAQSWQFTHHDFFAFYCDLFGGVDAFFDLADDGYVYRVSVE